MRDNRRLRAQFSHPVALLSAPQPRVLTTQPALRHFREPNRSPETCVSQLPELFWDRLQCLSYEAMLKMMWFLDSMFRPPESRVGEAIYTFVRRICLAYSLLLGIRLENTQISSSLKGALIDAKLP